MCETLKLSDNKVFGPEEGKCSSGQKALDQHHPCAHSIY